MQIHQLSVSHDEVQDRLLLRLNTQDAHEFRFWLTRRMVLRLLPAMDQSVVRLEATQPGVAAVDPGTQQILTDIKREAFLQQADFATPYSAHAQHFPLGSDPMLVTDVQLTLKAHGNLALVFQRKLEGKVQSCHLDLQAQLVHGLIHLLRETLVKAQWDTAAPLAVPRSESKPPLTVDATVYKH